MYFRKMCVFGGFLNNNNLKKVAGIEESVI